MLNASSWVALVILSWFKCWRNMQQTQAVEPFLETSKSQSVLLPDPPKIWPHHLHLVARHASRGPAGPFENILKVAVAVPPLCSFDRTSITTCWDIPGSARTFQDESLGSFPTIFQIYLLVQFSWIIYNRHLNHPQWWIAYPLVCEAVLSIHSPQVSASPLRAMVMEFASRCFWSSWRSQEACQARRIIFTNGGPQV